MVNKEEKLIEDNRKMLVKVGDWVIVRKPFPYTSKLIVSVVKRISSKGIFIAGHKEAFYSFYKLADK